MTRSTSNTLMSIVRPTRIPTLSVAPASTPASRRARLLSIEQAADPTYLWAGIWIAPGSTSAAPLQASACALALPHLRRRGSQHRRTHPLRRTLQRAGRREFDAIASRQLQDHGIGRLESAA